ncbi:hypothetical protein M0R45_030638 [Rubus argutus]|uniref:Uncharacterized protein n=1 Tax=Rubus argutus TaxID=59490 RepID=A0AAW1WDQ8_RUBAR
MVMTSWSVEERRRQRDDAGAAQVARGRHRLYQRDRSGNDGSPTAEAMRSRRRRLTGSAQGCDSEVHGWIDGVGLEEVAFWAEGTAWWFRQWIRDWALLIVILNSLQVHGGDVKVMLIW